MQWQLYVPEENRLYNKMHTTDVIYWNDGAENKDSILSLQTVRHADTVLGYPCDKLILTSRGGRQEFTFNTKAAPVEAALFARHKLAYWYEMIQQSHALPLKYTLDNPQFTITGTAVSITPQTLDDAMFSLPLDSKTEKAPE